MTGTDSDNTESSGKLDTTFLCKICIIVLLGLNLSEGQLTTLLI